MGATIAERWLYEFNGDPTGVDTRIINPPIGAIIFDPVTGDIRKKTTGFNDNSGYESVGTGSLLLLVNQPNGIAGLNSDAQLVGPIIIRLDTSANLDPQAGEDGELAAVTDDRGALRLLDGATDGGFGIAPPLLVAVTATAGNVTQADISKAAKYPGRAINVIVTAADPAAFSHPINLAAGSLNVSTLLRNRLLTIRLVVTSGENTTARTITAGGQTVIFGEDGANSDHSLVLGGSTGADLNGSAIVALWCVGDGGDGSGIQPIVVPLGGYNFAAVQL